MSLLLSNGWFTFLICERFENRSVEFADKKGKDV